GVRNARTVEASARTAEAANVMTAAPAPRTVAALKFARHSHAANLSTVEITATVPAAIAADVNRRRRSARRHHSNVRSRRLPRPEPKPARKAMARLVAASRLRRTAPTPRAAIARAHRHRRCARRLHRKPDLTPDRKVTSRLVAASPPRRSAPTPTARISSAKVVTVER